MRVLVARGATERCIRERLFHASTCSSSPARAWSRIRGLQRSDRYSHRKGNRLNYDREWELQNKIGKGSIVFARYGKALFATCAMFTDNWLSTTLCTVPIAAPMLVLSEPVLGVEGSSKYLGFFVLSCIGIGWIRVVHSSHNNSLLGHLIPAGEL